jgi:hypothetical protein
MSVAHPVRSISLAAALTGGLPSVWPFQHIATTTFGWPSEVTFGPICSRNRPRPWAAVKVAAAASLERLLGEVRRHRGGGRSRPSQQLSRFPCFPALVRLGPLVTAQLFSTPSSSSRSMLLHDELTGYEIELSAVF